MDNPSQLDLRRFVEQSQNKILLDISEEIDCLQYIGSSNHKPEVRVYIQIQERLCMLGVLLMEVLLLVVLV